MVALLGHRGVAKGSVVAVCLPNGLPVVELIHASFAGDFILHLVNTRLRTPEIEFQLRDSGARHFIHPASDSSAEAVELDEGVSRIRLDDVTAGGHEMIPADSHTRLTGGQRPITCGEALDLRQPRFILYTSGTTGRPKGVVLNAENLLASANGSAAILKGLNESNDGSTDCWLLCLPVFHVGGLSILLRSVLAGSAVVLHEKFLPEQVNRDLNHKGITGISLVASMLAKVLAVRGSQRSPKSLGCVLLGGGPAPAPLLAAAHEAGFPIAPTYGLTEASSQVATRRPDDPVDAGLRTLEGTEVRVVDDQGLPVATDRPGEIWVRGGSVTTGYWNRPEATREVLCDGWLRTGDIGALDADGRLTVHDRRSDLIVSGGENVYPAELESILLEHPSIAEAGVAGQKDETYGQRPVAWLVAADAENLPSASELDSHCRARLAGYKCPVKFSWVNALPRTASGKLLRRELTGSGNNTAK
jgi:O-succinylbenzoic acid--CoA ligase